MITSQTLAKVSLSTAGTYRVLGDHLRESDVYLRSMSLQIQLIPSARSDQDILFENSSFSRLQPGAYDLVVRDKSGHEWIYLGVVRVD